MTKAKKGEEPIGEVKAKITHFHFDKFTGKKVKDSEEEAVFRTEEEFLSAVKAKGNNPLMKIERIN